MTGLPPIASFGFDACDALIIAPPFYDLHVPSLGAHTIQACARAAGFDVRILYANLHFAASIGVLPYLRASGAFRGTFVGERLFARAAYGVPPLGERADGMFEMSRSLGGALMQDIYGDLPSANQELAAELPGLERQVPGWVEALAAQIVSLGLPVVGATSTFEQTAPALALLKSIKVRSPDTVAILGGANCEGEMADGMLELAPFLDHVFSGESEATFPAFLSERRDGRRAPDPIRRGKPCRNLDAIPLLDYDDYFAQRAALFGPDEEALLEPTGLPYETSRGCWWGEKNHCTFCGLNGEGMAFRARSADRAIDDLRSLTTRYATSKIMMTDNIMPHKFFTTFVPRLAEELPGLDIFYEQKANMSRDKLVALHRAGVDTIQPGIEALSSDLLRLMRKGVSGAQNIALLRDARGLNMALVWNLLWGFPGDLRRHYQETLELLPKLVHLQPPGGFWPVMIDRFCPYFEDPEGFGVSNIRPLPGYFDFLPPGAPAAKLAYHFEGDFQSEAYHCPALLREIQTTVHAWRSAWSVERTPELRIAEHSGSFILLDTRGVPGTEAFDVIDEAAAASFLASRPYTGTPSQRSLVERRLALHLDDWFVPLAIVDWRTRAVLEEIAAAAFEPGLPVPETVGAIWHEHRDP